MSYDDSLTQESKRTITPDSLSGLEKAAIVLMSLDGENATKVLSIMNTYEIKIISQAVLNLDRIPMEVIEVVLIEANKQLRSTVVLMQNIENTKHILNEILGEGQVNDIANNLREANSPTWTRLSQVDTEILAAYLKNEHPQAIALIISKLDAASSAKILALFPDELSLDVLTRIPNIDSVKRELLQSIEHTLREEFITNNAATIKVDYKKLVADIFNSFDRNTEEKFIKMIEAQDKAMAEYIQEYMFTFDHLIKIDNNGIQKILRLADKSKLTIALKGTTQEVKDLFFKNMSERASRIMQDDMVAMGPMRVREVDEAQSQIVGVARDLINSGEITISEGAEDELVY